MRSPFVPRAGTFSVANTGRPGRLQFGALVPPFSPLMKMALLAPSLSCKSCGTTLGLHVHTALPQEIGSSLAHMPATSANCTWLEPARVSDTEALAVSNPCGLPAPLPCRKAYSSNQASAL